MVRAKAAAAKRPPKKRAVEELYFRSDSAYLCLLLNRRTRCIRVIDFRAGALPAKRLYIQSVATQENVEKVITLVEKDEVSSWTRVGFVREGTIPGFYKRSDGHLCGCVIGDKTASIEVTDASAKLTERTINAAKKAAQRHPRTDQRRLGSHRDRKRCPLGPRFCLAEESGIRFVRHVRARRGAHLLRRQHPSQQDQLSLGRVPGLLRTRSGRGASIADLRERNTSRSCRPSHHGGRSPRARDSRRSSRLHPTTTSRLGPRSLRLGTEKPGSWRRESSTARAVEKTRSCGPTSSSVRSAKNTNEP